MDQSGWRSQNQSSVPLELEQMRNTIDTLDQTIAALLAQRLSLSGQIGQLKASAGLAIKDSSREQIVVENVKAAAGSRQMATALENVYTAIIKESCAMQNRKANGAEQENRHSQLQCNAVAERPARPSGRLYFPKVLILGVGLIGGAIARQIKNRMPSTVIIGIDHNASALKQAVAEGLVDFGSNDLADAVSRASLILLCATPTENLHLLEQIAAIAKRRQVIMDVTSTKQAICERAESLRTKADFIGGHPLFGSHKHGAGASGEVQLQGQRFCLVASRKSSELTVRRLSRWLAELGLHVVKTSARQHDQIVAATSHAIQLIGVAIGNSLARGRSDRQLQQVLQLSGPALRSFSRLMSSPPELWLDIIELNRQPIVDALTRLIAELEQIRHSVSSQDAQGLHERFAEAQRVESTLCKF